MNRPSLLSTALSLSLTLGACDTDIAATDYVVEAKANDSYGRIRRINGDSQSSIPESDPCLEVAKSLDITEPEYGKYDMFQEWYKDWKYRFDGIVSNVAPRPKELRDADAESCEMLGAEAGFTITRDGQFSGYRINPQEPDRSFAVMHQIAGKKISLKPYSMVPRPDGFDMSLQNACQDLGHQEWKAWDLFMPNSDLPQWRTTSIGLPCDPTAPATYGSGGCWYDKDGADGCGGGGSEINREASAALLECVRKAIVKKGEELCL